MAEPIVDGNVVYTDFAGNSGGETYVNTTFGGGRGGAPMDPMVPLKDYVDARDEAVETRVNGRLDKLPTKGTVWGAVATGIGLLLAALAFGGDRFDGGVGASGLLRGQAEKQAETDASQDAKLLVMDQKLDILIKQTADK
ncbi:hypothetical protein [Novosphingobium aquae]|uniref:Uncharacterized protein n=1 Tax=Novosphingobium aquae TaxID=3133435 RepID=A0ABU8S4Z4_9SPHN